MAYVTNKIFYVDNTPTDRLWTCMVGVEASAEQVSQSGGPHCTMANFLPDPDLLCGSLRKEEEGGRNIPHPLSLYTLALVHATPRRHEAPQFGVVTTSAPPSPLNLRPAFLQRSTQHLMCGNLMEDDFLGGEYLRLPSKSRVFYKSAPPDRLAWHRCALHSQENRLDKMASSVTRFPPSELRQKLLPDELAPSLHSDGVRTE